MGARASPSAELMVAPRGAPSPSHFAGGDSPEPPGSEREGEYGRTRRPPKNTGDDARVTPKSGNRFSNKVTRNEKWLFDI